jgi:hypothetical protein
MSQEKNETQNARKADLYIEEEQPYKKQKRQDSGVDSIEFSFEQVNIVKETSLGFDEWWRKILAKKCYF